MLTRKLISALLLIALTAIGCSDGGDPVDNDTPGEMPTLSVNDLSVAEGQTANFTVTLSMAATQNVSFSWTTAVGSASSADFTAGSGTDTIVAGATTATISVVTVQDTIPETSEMFTIVLSGASVVMTDSVGQCSINDDDVVTPSMFVNDVTVNEGDTAVFTVALSSAAASDINFTYTTGDGSATSQDDYTATSGSGLISAGSTSTTVNVATTEDFDVEPVETFDLVLTTSDAPFLDSVAVATIQDDDVVPTVFYQTDVQPLFISFGCVAPGCHGSGKVGNGFLMGLIAEWNMIRFGKGFGDRDVVVPGDASSSTLYLATTTNLPLNVTQQMPKFGPTKLTVEEQNRIRDWINEGAKDN